MNIPRLLLALCVLGATATWLAALEDPPPAGDDPAAGIEWKKPEGSAAFREAHALYLEKKYKDAVKGFKKALGCVESDSSKQAVDRWLRAATGGAELDQMRAQVAQSGKKSDALIFAKKNLPQYEGTAIYEEYKLYVANLEGEVFHVIESFNRPSGRYSEKQGKKFVDDKALVKEGSHCLEWTIVSNPATLKVEDIPKDLTQYQGIALWLHGPEKGASDVELIFMGKGKTNVGGKKTDNGYTKRVKCQNGWRRVEVPFKEFQPFGEISWSSVDDFRIHYTGPKGPVFYVDEIVLIRK